MSAKLPIDFYLEQILGIVTPLPAVKVQVSQGAMPLSRLYTDIRAALPIPIFDNSAVDGFAVSASADFSNPMRVAGDIPAGAAPLPHQPDSAIRVMTGAPIPTGCTDLIVVPVENTDAPGDHVLPKEVTFKNVNPQRSNIRRAGEHLKINDAALKHGTAFDAGAIATLISVGVSEVLIHPVPRVAVITTGDELTTDKSWGIPNSNGPMIVEALKALGVQHVYHHHCVDDIAALSALFDQLAPAHDLIITIGGISAGAFDVVKATGNKQGGFYFGEVAMKPGKPQGYGRWQDTPIICLPGNPVAAWVGFHLFGVPVVKKMAGDTGVSSISSFPSVQLTSNREVRIAPGMVAAVPVHIDWLNRRAYSVTHGSHMVGALANANGLALVNNDVSAGEMLRVILL